LRETCQLVRLKEAISMDRGELDDHPRAPWVVECVSEFLVSVTQQPEEIQVALMMALRGVQAKGFEFFKNALAEPLESDLPEFAEGLPV
jgi:hypothetical protein